MKPKRQKPKPLYKSPIWPIQKVLDTLGKRYRKANALYVPVLLSEKPKPYQYPSAQAENHMKGKTFIETFENFVLNKRKNHFRIEIQTQGLRAVEARNTIVLMDMSKKKQKIVLARIGIGFDKDAIIIEVVQGRKKGEEERNAFKSLVQKNWTTFMIEKIEDRAKKCGFKEIKIRRPETLTAYQLQKPEIQRQIRILYYSIAKSMNFKKRGPYFVKNLWFLLNVTLFFLYSKQLILQKIFFEKKSFLSKNLSFLK